MQVMCNQRKMLSVRNIKIFKYDNEKRIHYSGQEKSQGYKIKNSQILVSLFLWRETDFTLNVAYSAVAQVATLHIQSRNTINS